MSLAVQSSWWIGTSFNHSCKTKCKWAGISQIDLNMPSESYYTIYTDIYTIWVLMYESHISYKPVFFLDINQAATPLRCSHRCSSARIVAGTVRDVAATRGSEANSASIDRGPHGKRKTSRTASPLGQHFRWVWGEFWTKLFYVVWLFHLYPPCDSWGAQEPVMYAHPQWKAPFFKITVGIIRGVFGNTLQDSKAVLKQTQFPKTRATSLRYKVSPIRKTYSTWVPLI